MKTFILIALLISQNIWAVDSAPSKESQQKARRLFERIAGVPLSPNDPRFLVMSELLESGDDEKAAVVATDDVYFYQVTLKNLAAIMSNRTETPYAGIDDFQATFIGAVRDELDARTLLSGSYIYKAKPDAVGVAPSRRDNKHYDLIDAAGLDYKSTLVKQEPQWENFRNHAGLLTTRGWAKSHYDAGTNRRAVQYAFQEFLCLPIDSWKVAGLPDLWVGRDVDRSPGKDPKVYQEQCRTCHAGLDAARGAFGYMDYINDSFVELPQYRVAPKYSRNSGTYSDGHITTDDSFDLKAIAAHQPQIGFVENQSTRRGVQAFGELLANSQAFKECMATRVFSSVCQRAPQIKDQAALKVAAQAFEKDGFNLKKLFQKVAVLPTCLGE